MTTPTRITPYIDSCPVGCGASLLTTELRLPEGPLRRCTNCGQLLSAASESRYWKTMASFNASGFNQPTPHETERRRKVAGRRLKSITRLLGKKPADIRLVDVGCSRGQFVDFAAQAGFAAEGVEPAKHIAATARESGLNVHTGLLEDQHYPDAAFDVATLFEVVGQLHDPVSLMQECRRILKPDGVLVISTGNTASWTVGVMGSRWNYFHLEKVGGNISFYNPQSITILATVSGFNVERIETSSVRFHEKKRRFARAMFSRQNRRRPAQLACASCQTRS